MLKKAKSPAEFSNYLRSVALSQFNSKQLCAILSKEFLARTDLKSFTTPALTNILQSFAMLGHRNDLVCQTIGAEIASRPVFPSSQCYLDLMHGFASLDAFAHVIPFFHQVSLLPSTFDHHHSVDNAKKINLIQLCLQQRFSSPSIRAQDYSAQALWVEKTPLLLHSLLLPEGWISVQLELALQRRVHQLDDLFQTLQRVFPDVQRNHLVKNLVLVDFYVPSRNVVVLAVENNQDRFTQRVLFQENLHIFLLIDYPNSTRVEQEQSVRSLMHQILHEKEK